VNVASHFLIILLMFASALWSPSWDYYSSSLVEGVKLYPSNTPKHPPILGHICVRTVPQMSHIESGTSRNFLPMYVPYVKT
jgi:hypothetical protein